MTKNITLSVEASVLKSARKIAAEQETTVNGLVRRYLCDLAARKGQRQKARRELVEFIASIKTKAGKIRWSREELHER